MQYLLLMTVLCLSLPHQALFAQDKTYHDDAVQLAARLSQDQPERLLSEHLIYSLEDALVAVSESHFVAAHAISERFNIHALATASTTRLRIIVDQSADWLQHLEQTPIHQVILSEKFSLTLVEATEQYSILELFSEEDMNMKFIASELSVLNQIWMVEMPSIVRGFGDIKVKESAEGFHLTYQYNPKACSGDCAEAHYWTFEVSLDGLVNFVGEHGSDLADNSEDDEDYFFSLLEQLRQ